MVGFLHAKLRKGGVLMRFCKNCNVKMREVMSFSRDKNEKFNKCPDCFGETIHKKLKQSDFDKLLEAEIEKRR